VEYKFLQLFRIPETRKKIFLTLGILLFYRIGFQVPIPGMNPEYLRRVAESAGSAVFGLINAFSGGAIGQTAIFALGIMPYISASIIFSMLSKISPRIEAIAKEGATGHKKINQWTRLLTVPIAIVQSIFVYTGVFLQDPDIVSPTGPSGVGLFLIVVVSLTGGAMLVMWL
jgi:preprotein translocase subunit SecY